MSYDSLDLSGIGDYSDYSGYSYAGDDPDYSGVGDLDTSTPDLSYLDGTTDYSENFDLQGWMDENDPNSGKMIDLSNSDYYTDGSPIGDSGSESGSGPLGGISKFLGGLLGSGQGGDLSSMLSNLASLGLVGSNLYQDYQSNELGQDAMKLQNKLSNAAIKTNENNDYRTFTGQAGGFTGDAYNVAMNNQKMNLMMSLMSADENLPAGDRAGLTSALSGITNQYEPIYQGYANDDINRRNTEYSSPYNSLAPFKPAGQAQTFGGNQALMAGIPKDATPDSISAYLSYLNGGD